MPTRALLVCVLTLFATPAAAQSTTEDGLRAVLRGDYQAAASILKPLADAARPDPVAQFFLAVLYHSGQGVRRDQLLACGLFASAATLVNPFSEQSAAIAALLRMRPAAGVLCRGQLAGRTAAVVRPWTRSSRRGRGQEHHRDV